MRRFEWALLVAAAAALASTLVLLTAAGRLYRRGEWEGAGRRSRGPGVIAAVSGLVALATGRDIAAAVSRPRLFGGAILLLALAGIAAGLGGLSRKPVPSVYLAWASFSIALALCAASLFL